MTLFDIATSIPGLLTIALFTPIICIFAITIIQDFAEWTFDTISSFQTKPQKTEVTTTPKGENIIDFDTIQAISHIRNHEAMQFVSKN